MKRVGSIILLSLFLYNVIGYYITFSILNWQNNSEMSLIVKRSNSFKTLRIHKFEVKNIVFKDGENEICYKDEIYDVKNKTIEGDYIIFHCIKDNKEKKLISNLNDNVSNNIDTKSSSEKNQSEKSGQKNILKDYIFCPQVVVYYSLSQGATFKYPTSMINSFIVSISSPPPWYT